MTDTWEWPSINAPALARYVTPRRAVAALGFTPSVADHTTHDLLASGEQATLVGRIYDDLVARGIAYSLEPVNASTVTQRIRPPETVIGSTTRPGEGTCLDLAVLFAGLCQDRWLRPLVVVFEDHAIALVSVVDRHDSPYPATTGAFVNGVCDDAGALCQLVDDHKHLAVECTGFAVTKTADDARRDQSGTMSFADACAAGRTALSEYDLRFAIDPIVLHRGGVTPDDTVLPLDSRLGEFLLGAAKAKVAIDAISLALPQVTAVPTGNELDAIQRALVEVLKTYDVVLEVSKEWIEAAFGRDGVLDGATIATLTTGELVERIRDRRGHCGLIGELYRQGGGREYFARQLGGSDPRLGDIDKAFDELTGADFDFFDRAQEAGEFLQDEAGKVSDAILTDDLVQARNIVRAGAKHVAVLQQAIATNRRELKDLAHQLGIKTMESPQP